MKRRYFWWTDTSGANSFSLFRLTLLSLFWLFVAKMFIFIFSKGISESELYAVYAGVTIYAFVQISSELTQLSRSEALRLLPGFEPDLCRAAWLCVGILTVFAVLLSWVAIANWLTLSSTSYKAPVSVGYTAAVLAGLQLPAWNLHRQTRGWKFDTKNLGELALGWPAMLMLVAPAVALHWLPWNQVGLAMGIVAGLLLLVLPSLLRKRGMDIPPEQVGPIWRHPGMVVFGVVCMLIFAPLARPWSEEHAWAPAMLGLALPWMGLTAMNRERQILPALLGRMWLAGRSRNALCWFGLGRLFAAQAAEFGIYLGVAAIGCMLGRISLQALINLGLILIAYGWINWTRGVNDILLGTTVKRFAIERPMRKNFHIAVLALPWIVMGVVFAILGKHYNYNVELVKPFAIYLVGPVIAIFLILTCIYAWNAWQQRVDAFAFDETQVFSTKLKANFTQLLMNLPFVALIILAFLGKDERAAGLLAIGLAALLSIALTLYYFQRRFDTVEL
ncbi:MAG: hypothetical protein P4L87_11210 [Formivibrio sp.]|nr:hypothetical protein [Formivibrio sp.]